MRVVRVLVAVIGRMDGWLSRTRNKGLGLMG